MAEPTTKNTVELTMGYSNTDFKRKYTISDVTAEAFPQVESKAKAINASIAGGTDDGLADFFRADDYDDSDPNNVVGKFTGITALKTKSVTETVIYQREAE